MKGLAELCPIARMNYKTGMAGADRSSEFHRGGPCLAIFVFLHIGAQQGVDAGLIAWSLSSVPFENVAVHSDGKLLFSYNRL